MQILENVSLKPFHTFGLDVKARWFTEIRNAGDLAGLYEQETWKLVPKLILGGGSNLLFTGDVDGLVVKMAIEGIEMTGGDNEYVYVRSGAGEKWHKLVMYCIENGWAGIENLSLIPGTVGAAPMQNIGAYGVELKDVFYSLEAFDIHSGNMVAFYREDCRFGYRESVFKNVYKNKYVITAVTLKLSREAQLNVCYGAITQTLEEMGIIHPTIRDVSNAVIRIRQSKLPDPLVLGNAGSFFKNPEIPDGQFGRLKIHYPDIPGYPASVGNTKLAAGWLIEQCGWKGKRVGNTGAHKDQALVLVNYGGASGHEIWQLALEIKKSVWDKFGVTIEPEVNVVG